MHRVQEPEVIGRAPERLTPKELTLLAGRYIALEIYTPANLALRRIEAMGGSVAECVRQLRERGLDPAGYEFQRLGPAFQ